MRVLLSKKSNKRFFEFLKKEKSCKNLRELALRLKIPFKTLEKWRYQDLYIPEKIIPTNLKFLKIIYKREDNWGNIKGGKIGGKKNNEFIRKELGEERYSELMRQKGEKVKNTLWKRFEKRELIKKAIDGKIKKRESESKDLELKNNKFFTNKKVILDNRGIKFSRADQIKNIKLPLEMNEELAEETGIHLGDGCLSTKNYFSVKCNKKEEKYVMYFFKLYKKIYGIELKLMQLKSVSGFEIYSKAIFEFKNKTLGISYGNKKERIEVPKMIIDTKNKGIYCSFIRGLFDTDGHVYITKRYYPKISITIKSKKIMQQLYKILRKMGFIPTLYRWTLTLNGTIMLNKWIKEIGSNNPKNIEKLRRASSIKESMRPCGNM